METQKEIKDLKEAARLFEKKLHVEIDKNITLSGEK